jgi:hypothetical protein
MFAEYKRHDSLLSSGNLAMDHAAMHKGFGHFKEDQ